MIEETKLSSDIVEGALENIQKHGWRRHSFGDEQEGFCLLGAIAKHLYGKWDRDVFYGVEQELLEYFGGETFIYRCCDFCDNADQTVEGVAEWNDYVAKDQMDVENKLMEIAKDLRNKGK